MRCLIKDITLSSFTARAMGRFCGDPDDRQKAEDLMRDLTEKQLEKWGVKYHELLFGKPHADVFIDDKKP